MARGKHEAKAARARYEATLQVVDRLNEKNAEMKVKARHAAAEAAAAPALRARVAELERQVVALETPKLEAFRAEMTARIDDRDELLRWCAEMLSALAGNVMKLNLGEEVLVFPRGIIEGENTNRLRRDYGFVFNDTNRHLRRGMTSRRTDGDRNMPSPPKFIGTERHGR